MTAPNDDLEAALRQALSAAASQVEPVDGGLDRIRARTSGATPRPLLVSMALEVTRRARHWVWRGHWAWQDAGYWRDHRAVRRAARLIRAMRAWLAASTGHGAAWLRATPWPAGIGQTRIGLTRIGRTRLAVGRTAAASGGRWAVSLWVTLRPHGIGWIRLVAGLAAAASITAAAVAVPPLRAALVQVSSTVLNGGNSDVQPLLSGTGGSGGGDGKTAAAAGRQVGPVRRRGR